MSFVAGRYDDADVAYRRFTNVGDKHLSAACGAHQTWCDNCERDEFSANEHPLQRVVHACIAGRRDDHGAATSICEAKRMSKSSRYGAPTNCTPIGRPLALVCSGRLIAG